MNDLPLDVHIEKQTVKIKKCSGVYFPAEDSILLASSIPPTDTLLEIGCGSGFVSIYMAMMGSRVCCSDIDTIAVQCTKINANLNAVDITVLHGDLFSAVSGSFKTIVFNPPYLSGEDSESNLIDGKQWYGGKDGFQTIRRFLSSCDKYLEKNGSVYIILSSLTDIKSLRDEFSQLVFKVVGQQSFFFEHIYCFMVSGFK